jgi:ABC-type sugar transport system permease subunit
VPLVVLSFVLAYLVYIGLPGQWLWRLSFFAPYLLPVSVAVAIWQWMFQPDFGLFNGLLLRAGFAQIPFLSEASLAMFSVVVVTVWWTLGFNFLLYLSALNNIPDHLYEAASIDGAGPWRRLFSITIPMINRTTVMIIMLQILASLKVFEQIFLLTNGGPNGATRSVLEYIYDVGPTHLEGRRDAQRAQQDARRDRRQEQGCPGRRHHRPRHRRSPLARPPLLGHPDLAEEGVGRVQRGFRDPPAGGPDARVLPCRHRRG